MLTTVKVHACYAVNINKNNRSPQKKKSYEKEGRSRCAGSDYVFDFFISIFVDNAWFIGLEATEMLKE